jgi:hypothetical protein
MALSETGIASYRVQEGLPMDRNDPWQAKTRMAALASGHSINETGWLVRSNVRATG